MPKKKRRKRKICGFSLCCTANISDSDEDTKDFENAFSNVCSQADEAGSSEKNLTATKTGISPFGKNKNVLQKQKYQNISKDPGVPPSKESQQDKKTKNGPLMKIRASLSKLQGKNVTTEATVPVKMPIKRVWTFSEVFKYPGRGVSSEKGLNQINENLSKQQSKPFLPQASKGAELNMVSLAQSSSRETYVDESSERRMCTRRPRDKDFHDNNTSVATHIEVLIPADFQTEEKIRSSSFKKTSRSVGKNIPFEKMSIETDLNFQNKALHSMKVSGKQSGELRRQQSFSPEKNQPLVKQIPIEMKSFESDLQIQKQTTRAMIATEIEAAKPTDRQREIRQGSPVTKDISIKKKPVERYLQSQEQTSAPKKDTEIESIKPTDFDRERRSHSLSLKKSSQVVVKDIHNEKMSYGSSLHCQKETAAPNRASEMEAVKTSDVNRKKRSRSSSKGQTREAVFKDFFNEKRSIKNDLKSQKETSAQKEATESEVVLPIGVHRDRRSRSLSLKKSSQAVLNGISDEKSVESDLQCQKETATPKKATDVLQERRSRSSSLKKSCQEVVKDISDEQRSIESKLDRQRRTSAHKKATELESVKLIDLNREQRQRSSSRKKNSQEVVKDSSDEQRSIESKLDRQRRTSAHKKDTELESVKLTDLNREKRQRSSSYKKNSQEVVKDISDEQRSIESKLDRQRRTSAHKKATELESVKQTDLHREKRQQSLSLKNRGQDVVKGISTEKEPVEKDLQSPKQTSLIMNTTEEESMTASDDKTKRILQSSSLRKSCQAIKENLVSSTVNITDCVRYPVTNGIIDVTGFIPCGGCEPTPLNECVMADGSQTEKTMIDNAISDQVVEFVKLLAIQAAMGAVKEQILPIRNTETDKMDGKKELTVNTSTSNPESLVLVDRGSKHDEIRHVSVTEGQKGRKLEFGLDQIPPKESTLPTMKNKCIMSCLNPKGKNIAVKKNTRLSDDITIRCINDFAPGVKSYSEEEMTIANMVDTHTDSWVESGKNTKCSIAEEFKNERGNEFKPPMYTFGVEKNNFGITQKENSVTEELTSLGQIKEVDNPESANFEERLPISWDNAGLVQKDKTCIGEDRIFKNATGEKGSADLVQKFTSLDKKSFISNETNERDLTKEDMTRFEQLVNSQSWITERDNADSIQKDSTCLEEDCISSSKEWKNVYSVQKFEENPNIENTARGTQALSEKESITSNKEPAIHTERNRFADVVHINKGTCEEQSNISPLPWKERMTLEDKSSHTEQRDSSDLVQKERHMSTLIQQDYISSEEESIISDNVEDIKHPDIKKAKVKISVEQKHISSCQGKSKDGTPDLMQKDEDRSSQYKLQRNPEKNLLDDFILKEDSTTSSASSSKKSNKVHRIQRNNVLSEQHSRRSKHFISRRNPDFMDDFVFKEDSTRLSSSTERNKVHRIQRDKSCSEDEPSISKQFTSRRNPDFMDDLAFKEDSIRSRSSTERIEEHRIQRDKSSEEESSRSKHFISRRNPGLMDDFVFKEDSTTSCSFTERNKVHKLQREIDNSVDKPLNSFSVEHQRNPESNRNESISFENEHIKSSQYIVSESQNLLQKAEGTFEEDPVIPSQSQESNKPTMLQREGEKFVGEPIILRQDEGWWNLDMSETNHFSFETESFSLSCSKERDNVDLVQNKKTTSKNQQLISKEIKEEESADLDHKDEATLEQCSTDFIKSPSKIKEWDTAETRETNNSEVSSSQFKCRRNTGNIDDFFPQENSITSSPKERNRVHRIQRDNSFSEEKSSRSKQFTSRRNPGLMDDFVFKEDSTSSRCSPEKNNAHKFQRDNNCVEEVSIRSKQFISRRNPGLMEDFIFKEDSTTSCSFTERNKVHRLQREIDNSVDKPLNSFSVEHQRNPESNRNESISFENEHVNSSQDIVSESENLLQKAEGTFEEHPVIPSQSQESNKPTMLQREGERFVGEPIILRQDEGWWNLDMSEMNHFSFETESFSLSCSKERDNLDLVQNKKTISKNQQLISKEIKEKESADLDHKDEATHEQCSIDFIKSPSKIKERDIAETRETNNSEVSSSQFKCRRNTGNSDYYYSITSSPKERNRVHRIQRDNSFSEEKSSRSKQFISRRNPGLMDDFVFKDDSTRSNSSTERNEVHRIQRDNSCSEEEPSRSKHFISRRNPNLMDDFVFKGDSTRSSCSQEKNIDKFIQVNETASGEVMMSKQRDEDSIGFVQRFASIVNQLGVQARQNKDRDMIDLIQEDNITNKEQPNILNRITDKELFRTRLPQGNLKNSNNAGANSRHADIQNKKRSAISKSVRFSEDRRTWILGDSMPSDVDCGYNKDKVINIQQMECHRDMLVKPEEHRTTKNGKLPKLRCEKTKCHGGPVVQVQVTAKKGKVGKRAKEETKPTGQEDESESCMDVYSDDTDYDLDSDVFCSDDDQPPDASTKGPSQSALTLGYQKLPAISKGTPTSAIPLGK